MRAELTIAALTMAIQRQKPPSGLTQLRPFDHIEVLADDGSFCAELLVLMATKTQATVMELRKIDISTKEGAPVEQKFAVKWRGPHSKWSVMKLSCAA
jgi:hypothetical protein